MQRCLHGVKMRHAGDAANAAEGQERSGSGPVDRPRRYRRCVPLLGSRSASKKKLVAGHAHVRTQVVLRLTHSVDVAQAQME
jgi:hypothetical protein